MTHICVGKLTIIGSNNGLSPGRCQTIFSTNAGILLIGLIGKNFSEIVHRNAYVFIKKIHFKLSSGKRRPFCLGLNVFKHMCTLSVNFSIRFTPLGLYVQSIWVRNKRYFYHFDKNYYHWYNRLISGLPANVVTLPDVLKLSLTHRGRVSNICVGKLDFH